MTPLDLTAIACPCCGGEVFPLDLIVDEATGFIAFGGVSERFTPAEFRPIKSLIDRYPGVVTKDQCLDALSDGSDNPPLPKIVDVKICHVRRKADRLGLVITTIWGTGYRLELADQAKAEALRAQRFNATRHTRTAIDSGDVSAIKMLRAQGYPITDIARRLRLTFKAVMTAIEIVEAENAKGRDRIKAA